MGLYVNLSTKERARFQKYHNAAAAATESATKAAEYQSRMVLRRFGIRDSLEASDLIHDLETTLREAKVALTAAKKMQTMLK
jgi:hypothetical protein